MDAARDKFAASGCSVVVVSQAKPALLTLYLSRFGWHVPLVSDENRVAYRVFGLERTNWRTFFRPSVLWGYFRGMLRGYGVRKPYVGEDVLQLGGDFLLAKGGRVLFAYSSATPTDRPAVTSLLQALPSAGPMPPDHGSDAPRVDAVPRPD